jgi:peptide/nickel transport system permease protein
VIRYLGRRVAGSLAVIAGLLLFTFVATHVIGDPTNLIVDRELATDADRKLIRSANGFDDPVLEQFLRFAGGALRGDFGNSLWQNRPAGEVVLERIPATLLLTLLTVIVSFAVALVAAGIAVWKHGTAVESTVAFLATALACIPSFWLALALVMTLAVRLSLFPTSGYGSWNHLVLPVLALSAQPIGQLTQVLHASLLAERSRAYVWTARAKGLRERAVIARHMLRNTAVVTVTMFGSMLALLLNGAILAEAVFAWPGLGTTGLLAVRGRDLPVLVAVVFYAGVMVALVNLLVDLAYAMLDPRVRYA